MSEDTFVQVAPNSTGAQIRNFKVRGMPQSDGTYADVYIQAITVVDSDGYELDNGGARIEQLLAELLKETQALRKMYSRATGQYWNAADALGNDI